MRKYIHSIVLFTSGAFLLTACGFNQPNFFVHDKKETSFRLGSVTAQTSNLSDEEKAACSIHMYLHSAAKITLKEGFNYFAIVDNRGDIAYESNMKGMAINTSAAYIEYCNPNLNNNGTGLEDDKCQYHPMGYDISSKWGGQIYMLKERTYLFPTWDARKVMREEGAKANACIDWSKYSKASSLRDAKIVY
jgi:hypothetical protein